MEKPRKWRYGVNRWIILATVILGIFAAMAFPPVLVHIQMPAEPLAHTPLFSAPLIGDFYLTNTLVATVIAYIILLLIAWSVRRAATSGELVPRGLPGAVEAFLEVIYNLTETTAGKWTRSIFPFFATITLLVLVVNWMELIPGVDSIGRLEHPAAGGHGYPVQQVLPGVFTIVREESTEAAAEAETGTEEPITGEHAEEAGYTLVPFVRVASTDLNFTVALALISVVMVQVMGFKALGLDYFTKYWNTKTLFSKPFFGAIDFAVGLLEIVSEISKILSFSFRLFGNIFAGSVLLFVIGFLVPVFAQSIFLLLEFGVGLIQAVVFGMLTMVFMAQATQGHGEGHAHTEEEEQMPIEKATI